MTFSLEWEPKQSRGGWPTRLGDENYWRVVKLMQGLFIDFILSRMSPPTSESELPQRLGPSMRRPILVKSFCSFRDCGAHCVLPLGYMWKKRENRCFC